MLFDFALDDFFYSSSSLSESLVKFLHDVDNVREINFRFHSYSFFVSTDLLDTFHWIDVGLEEKLLSVGVSEFSIEFFPFISECCLDVIEMLTVVVTMKHSLFFSSFASWELLNLTTEAFCHAWMAWNFEKR